METPPPRPATVQLRLRVYRGEEAALGPGRTELLTRIGETASIAQAARDMGMSYMKAWKLIQSMNRCFREPLIEVRRGGKAGGTARLTPTGETALGLYRQMERESRAAIRSLEEPDGSLLRDDGDPPRAERPGDRRSERAHESQRFPNASSIRRLICRDSRAAWFNAASRIGGSF